MAAQFALEHWSPEDYAALLERLEALAEPDYRAFQIKLTPGLEHMLGVRTPALRALAKQIAKGDAEGFLACPCGDLYEEKMLRSMVIGYAIRDIDRLLAHLERFVPTIDNWAVCDNLCGGLKLTRKHRDTMLRFLTPYLASEREYELRFALVMLLCHYIEDDYIERVLEIYGRQYSDAYYVRMAQAWGISYCYAAYPDRTLAFLRSCTLDPFTYRKSIQKTLESYRVSEEHKGILRELRAALPPARKRRGI